MYMYMCRLHVRVRCTCFIMGMRLLWYCTCMFVNWELSMILKYINLDILFVFSKNVSLNF